MAKTYVLAGIELLTYVKVHRFTQVFVIEIEANHRDFSLFILIGNTVYLSLVVVNNETFAQVINEDQILMMNVFGDMEATEEETRYNYNAEIDMLIEGIKGGWNIINRKDEVKSYKVFFSRFYSLIG